MNEGRIERREMTPERERERRERALPTDSWNHSSRGRRPIL